MSVPHHAQTGDMPAERAIRLWVEAANRHHGLDPLYRRRMRSIVMNRFAAASGPAPLVAVPERRMGSLGRACLYASVALALSVGSAMGVSGAAIPGDALYPLKRQIEEIREAVLPAQFRDELAAHEFAQRAHELGRLLEVGDLARATVLLPELRASYERLTALQPDGAADDQVVGVQLSILNDLLDQLPTQAADAIRQAIGDAPGLSGETPRERSDEAPAQQSGEGPKATPGVLAGADDAGGRPPPDDQRTSGDARGPAKDRERGRSPDPTASPEAPAPIVPDDEGD